MSVPRKPKKTFRFVGVGFYDDYGSIDGFDNEKGITKGDWWEYQFMVHESVADGLLHKPLREFKDLGVAAWQLIYIAHSARIQVMGNDLLGSQYFDREEIELQRKITQLTLSILDKKEAQLREYKEE